MVFKKGSIPWSKGKKGLWHHTEEFKRKLSERVKGKPFTNEHKRKISEALKGKPKTEEHMKRLSHTFFKKGEHRSPDTEFKKGQIGRNKGKSFSEETKKKISEARKEYYETHSVWNKSKTFILTPEQYMKRYAKERAQKISEANKGKIVSEETRRKLSESHKGKPLSEDTRKKLSASHLRNPIRFWLGKHHSEETKRKLKVARNRPEAIERSREIRSHIIIPFRDTKIEKILQDSLTLLGIDFVKHKSIRLPSGRRHQVDLFIEPNKCIEAYGDYYHCNPNSIYYKPKTETQRRNVKNDEEVNKGLAEMGFRVIRIWESDIVKPDFDIKRFLGNCVS